MLFSFKYRIYPNTEQQQYFAKCFGACRFVYNWGLEQRKSAWEEHQDTLSYCDQAADLSSLKRKLPWLQEIDSQSLQQSLRNLDSAFKNFFRRVEQGKTPGYPKFKTKHYNKQSFISTCCSHVDFLKHTIKIPKCSPVKAKLHREFTGVIKRITISKTATNKYYAAVLIEDGFDKLPDKSPIALDTALGIDLGLTHFAILSTGEKIDNPRFLQRALSRLKILQRRAARKKKGSKNRTKANLRVAILHEYIKNLRADFLHKLSYRLTHENQVKSICIENLQVRNMQSSRFSRSISDAGWGEFRRQLSYKSDWYGVNLILVDPRNTTRTCSNCRYIHSAIPTNIRSWWCPNCGVIHDRDINAAVNIKHSGADRSSVPGEQSVNNQVRQNQEAA